MKRKGGEKHGCSLDAVRGCNWGSRCFAVGGMNTRCAWCDEETRSRCEAFGVTPVEEVDCALVSHGICDYHAEQVNREIVEMKRRQGVNV